MKLTEAKRLAKEIVAVLSLYCDRVEIAGSIRREKPEVKDIEIVCIPRQRDLMYFCDLVRKWEKVKGEPYGKYTQRMLPEGIKLDLFMATKMNWGLILAIRTGSAEYSHRILATGWKKNGYTSIEGMLHKGGEAITMYEEEDVFMVAGIPYVRPFKREV